MYKLEKTKNGFWTLKCGDKYISSKYDPIREGQQFAKGNIEALKNEQILVYGIGLGYHIKAMADMMDEKSKLYVFEYNSNLIDYCRKVNGDIFNLHNVIIIDGGKDKKFYKKFSDQLKETNQLIIHKPSLDTIYNINNLLFNLVNDFSRVRQQHSMQPEIQIESEINFKANTKNNSHKIDDFINKYKSSKKAYIIAAAGPSIDDEIELLKKNREKFNIFAVGSALRTLTDNGIYPDCVVIIDPRKIVEKQIENIDCSNLNLCYDANASRSAVEKFLGEKYIFNNINDDSIEIRTSGTVAVAAIDIAIKCNAKKIIMLGQDLALLNNKSHTKTFEKTYGFKDHVIDNGINRVVKAFNGEKVKTTQGYITFKNKIESIIRFNQSIEFINCSKGAYIEGAEHRSFYEVCK